MAGGLEPDRGGPFPLGAAVTVAELDGNPHPLLHRLRAAEPVSWLPALGGWLVTRHDLALAVMRDSRAYTVDDPRFSTAQVVGPSMLSLDGGPHRRHTDPAEILAWYEKIVTAVTALSAASADDQRPAGPTGRAAFGELSERVIAAVREPGATSLLSAAAAEGGLTPEEIASDAAVLMF